MILQICTACGRIKGTHDDFNERCEKASGWFDEDKHVFTYDEHGRVSDVVHKELPDRWPPDDR